MRRPNITGAIWNVLERRGRNYRRPKYGSRQRLEDS